MNSTSKRKKMKIREKGQLPRQGDVVTVLAPDNLPAQMRLLVQLLTRRFQEVISAHQITPLHWGILSCLWYEDGVTTRAIVDRLDQLGGTVTVGLDSMEKRRLIRRSPDLHDGRISRIWLTKRGANLEKKVVPQVKDFMDKVFSCLSEREHKKLGALVWKLRLHVEAMK